MQYNKLVRDKIPEIIKKHGLTAVTHTAESEEYRQKLKEKLQEEVDEFLRESNAEELADVLEVVYALAEFLEIDKEKLELARKKKAEERGGFQRRIILEETR